MGQPQKLRGPQNEDDHFNVDGPTNEELTGLPKDFSP